MEWTGAIGLVGTVVGAAGTTWAIVSDRSRLRTLERSAELLDKLPKGSEALGAVKALMDEVSADMLRSYRNPSSGRWQISAGFALLLIGLIGLLGLFYLSNAWDFYIETWLLFALMMLAASIFTAGYALMLIAVLNRRRHRLRIRTRNELLSMKERARDRKRRDWWRPRRRRLHVRVIRDLEAEIKRIDARAT